jgi:aminoglycoside 6'-N-acetyltransferase
VIVTGPRLSFRSLGREDFRLLSTWLAAPHVRRWWREESAVEAVEARYGPVVDGTDVTECFIVELDFAPMGFIQRYRLDDHPEWQRSLSVAGTPDVGAGIDYFIGSETFVGNGLGPEIIDRFVEDTWERYPDIEAIVVDVSSDNRPSWRALEKAGFERVWSGELVSADPSDAGVSHVYVRHRIVSLPTE